MAKRARRPRSQEPAGTDAHRETVLPALSIPSFPVILAKAGRKRESRGLESKWIPAFAGMTSFLRACARVSIDPGAQAELCA